MRPVTTEPNEALGLMGLARRAGAVTEGTDGVREAVRSGGVCLVVMAADASPGQLNKVRALLEHRRIPVRWVATRTELGRAIGRSVISVVAVTRHTFAEQLLERLSPIPPNGHGGGSGSQEAQGGFRY